MCSAACMCYTYSIAKTRGDTTLVHCKEHAVIQCYCVSRYNSNVTFVLLQPVSLSVFINGQIITTICVSLNSSYCNGLFKIVILLL